MKNLHKENITNYFLLSLILPQTPVPLIFLPVHLTMANNIADFPHSQLLGRSYLAKTKIHAFKYN
jgi:hypothetical protein